MKRIGLKNKKGKIENLIMVDDVAKFEPPEGYEIFDDETAEIGDEVKENKLIKPEIESIPEPDYTVLRAAEYPAAGDQLDVIWKQINKLRLDGVELIQEADDMLGEILAVKKKHPKKKRKK